MTYTAKAAVCSEIPTKHSTQSENHVEFCWHVKKPLGFERLTIWIPLKLILFKIFGLGHDWRTLLRARTQTADNFLRNSLACGSLNLLASYC
jgi:hypothetical protein